jgi:hypothetical protein
MRIEIERNWCGPAAALLCRWTRGPKPVRFLSLFFEFDFGDLMLWDLGMARVCFSLISFLPKDLATRIALIPLLT